MLALPSSVERDDFERYLVPSYAPADFVPVRGQGVRVWDQQGREWIDLAGGIAVNSLGHCHPALVHALTEQAQKLWHMSNVFTNEPALRLARKLVAATFAERVFFCNSGAEANEAAFKLARRVAHDRFGVEKSEIIAATNSFHGRTLFTVSVGGQAKYSEGFGPKIQGITHVPYNDIEALRAAISERTCAIVLEPIQGEGGVLPADADYLAAARALCNQYQALLIFDEVQSGMGRTGALFAYMRYGICPDILSSAKSLGGGFPIGAVLTTESLAAHFSVGTHGTTYGGNPLACAVAEAVLDVVNTPAVLEGVLQRHQQIKSHLERLGQTYKVFSQVRGLGLLVGAVLSEPWQGAAKKIVDVAAAHGVLILQAGPNVLRFAPSLVIESAEIELAMQRLAAALAECIHKYA